jgi:hypothetical protein
MYDRRSTDQCFLLLISLASGVPHITNYQPGYELIYPPGSGLYWGKNVRSVAEVVAVVLAMPRRNLLALGEQAASFARELRTRAPHPGSYMVRLIEDVSAFRSANAGHDGYMSTARKS